MYSDPSNLNHEVIGVGYVRDNGKDYLIIRNSWSVNWGEDGYALASMDDNTCGINAEAIFLSL